MPDLASADFWIGIVIGVLLTLSAFGLDRVITLVHRYARTFRRRATDGRPR